MTAKVIQFRSDFRHFKTGKTNPCCYKKSHTSAAAHTRKNGSVPEGAMAVNNDLASNWGARQGCNGCDCENSARTNADILDRRDLCTERWSKANTSTGADTKERCKEYYRNIASSRQP